MPRKTPFIGASAASEPMHESVPAATPEQAVAVRFISEHASLVVRAGDAALRFVDGVYTTSDQGQIALLRSLTVCREVVSP